MGKPSQIGDTFTGVLRHLCGATHLKNLVAATTDMDIESLKSRLPSKLLGSERCNATSQGKLKLQKKNSKAVVAAAAAAAATVLTGSAGSTGPAARAPTPKPKSGEQLETTPLTKAGMGKLFGMGATASAGASSSVGASSSTELPPMPPLLPLDQTAPAATPLD